MLFLDGHNQNYENNKKNKTNGLPIIMDTRTLARQKSGADLQDPCTAPRTGAADRRRGPAPMLGADLAATLKLSVVLQKQYPTLINTISVAF